MADILVDGGDPIRQPVLLTAGDVIPDLTGCTISAGIFWRGEQRFALSEGDGIEVMDVTPTAELYHLIFTVDGADTLTFPMGRIAYIKFQVVTSSGISVTFERQYFKRVE